MTMLSAEALKEIDRAIAKYGFAVLLQ